MTTKILIGADPELFVYTDKGKPVSAHDLLDGTKYDPFPVLNGAVQVDGVAAEFNIDPAETEYAFVANIKSVTDQMLQEIHKRRKDVLLKATPTIKFTRMQWSKIPEDAKLLGCEPDFSAYKPLVPNERPSTDKFMRTGSGHVHVSWSAPIVQNPSAQDYLKKCASLIWHFDTAFSKEMKKWDKDEERMELYGKMGTFRPKKYGVEYRTLSNAWLNREDTMKYVFRTVKLCTEKWLEGCKPASYDIPEYKGE